MTAIIDETDAMLKTHKVNLNKINRKDNKFKINGLPAEELLYNGRDEDGPTMVSITFVTIHKSAVVFTYWASIEGNKEASGRTRKNPQQPASPRFLKRRGRAFFSTPRQPLGVKRSYMGNS